MGPSSPSNSPTGRNAIIEYSGPHGGFPEGDRPMCPALARFVRGSFTDCQSGPICALLESIGLTERARIIGIAAGPAIELLEGQIIY